MSGLSQVKMSGLDILFGDKFARIGVIINEPERVR
jgi:hypothetical protein